MMRLCSETLHCYCSWSLFANILSDSTRRHTPSRYQQPPHHRSHHLLHPVCFHNPFLLDNRHHHHRSQVNMLQSVQQHNIFILLYFIHRELRVVPALQSLANQSLSQGLTLLILVISYERDEVLGVCYALGVVLQYLYLVSLSWMAVHPVVICIEIFKRLLYEKTWLIWPFVVACWCKLGLQTPQREVKKKKFTTFCLLTSI